MHNPIFALAMGGLVGLPSGRKAGALRRAESALAAGSELLAGGRAAEAEAEFRRAAGLVAGRPGLEERPVLAEALDGLGHSLSEDGRIEPAGLAFRDALEVREAIAADDPGPGPARDLALAREALARALAEVGQVAEAIGQRRAALQTWDALTAHPPVDPDLRQHRVAALNDLAWLLSIDPAPALRDPAGALALAEEAIRIAPDHEASWNTLGVARYRAGDLLGAIEALERSAASSPGGGTAFDWYPLSMAYRRLGDGDRARHWFDRAVAWADRHRPGHPTLAQFRAEAAALL